MSDNIASFLQLRKRYITSQFGNLNDVQKTAVFATEGPLLILAGAGSGKTTVLVNRIANLISFGSAYNADNMYTTPTQSQLDEMQELVDKGGIPSAALMPLISQNAVRPWNILAITFTNKAAGELKSRLCAMLGEVTGGDVNASTFHSMCVKMLRREAEHLGFPKAFTIYDSDDQKRAMKLVYASLSVDDKFLPIKVAVNAISSFKDKMVSPEEALGAPADSKAGLIAKIYNAYQLSLQKAGAMDFDDLIYNTVLLLSKVKEVRDYYQNRYKYILVDEYQDTSVAQFRLVSLLTGEGQNICVVGDDDQSIYRFRGATIENILSFEQYFLGAKVIRLEENYRSTSNILNAANGVIKNNQGRKGKTLWTKNEDGELIAHYTASNEFDEASHIATIVGDNLKKGAKLRDHAILYRMNAQSSSIETYFARAGIPYKIIGGQRFFDRKEVKDVIAYMSIVANNKDDLRLRRIINEPARKIGGVTIEGLANAAAKANMSMLEYLSAALEDGTAKVSPSLIGFYQIYCKLCQQAASLPMDLFVTELIETTGYRAMLLAQEEEGKTRLENIGQLVSSVKTYADQRGAEATLEGYLEEVALISDLDSYEEGADVIVMMTMHAAKGLEFDYVFIVGMEDGIFPSEMSRFSDDDLEEERRLCYVGLTRAKKQLFLSSAESRMIFGQTKRNRISRFLTEIDSGLISANKAITTCAPLQDLWGAPTPLQQAPTPVQPRTGGWSSHASTRPAYKAPTVGTPTIGAPQQKNITFKTGDIVDHKVFGRGKVLNVTPVAGDNIVEIHFDTAGVKKTMANYAPLSLVE